VHANKYVYLSHIKKTLNFKYLFITQNINNATTFLKYTRLNMPILYFNRVRKMKLPRSPISWGNLYFNHYSTYCIENTSICSEPLLNVYIFVLAIYLQKIVYFLCSCNCLIFFGECSEMNTEKHKWVNNLRK
jgi:hypothetical protein